MADYRLRRIVLELLVVLVKHAMSNGSFWLPEHVKKLRSLEEELTGDVER